MNIFDAIKKYVPRLQRAFETRDFEGDTETAQQKFVEAIQIIRKEKEIGKSNKKRD